MAFLVRRQNSYPDLMVRYYTILNKISSDWYKDFILNIWTFQTAEMFDPVTYLQKWQEVDVTNLVVSASEMDLMDVES